MKNNTMTPLVHDAMLASAQHRPNAMAVEFGDQQLTYKDLKQGAYALASRLTTNHDKAEEEERCIAIFMDKRVEAILALYGILQAGCAYVPLDTKNPAARIHHIIDQCAITTVITTPEFVGSLNDMLAALECIQGRAIDVLVISQKPWATPEALQPCSNVHYEHLNAFAFSAIDNIDTPLTNIHSNQLAAVLYTSGSTGTPKGVMITHANICLFVAWVITYFKVTSEDRLASHAPLYFDLSLLDIFAAHGAAATSVLIPEAMVGNPKYLTRFIAEHKITIWQSVPSALTLMLKYGAIVQSQYPQLRHVLFAGERMSAQTVIGLTQHFQAATFHNIYGSTETNDTFIYSVAASAEDIPDPLPIGSPLPYVDYLIESINIDDDTTDTDQIPGNGKKINNNYLTGTEGELLVKAPTLMRGYRGRPPINTGDGMEQVSYYRTSDIVKVLPDGSLSFLGRIDDVIKTNGYRVNLLAIEAVLQAHGAIQDVAVFAIPDDDLGNKIIAFVSTSNTDEINAIALRLFCAEKLPKYSIPHLFNISSQALPKTSSGKTNKKLLSQDFIKPPKQSLTTKGCNHVEYS